MQSKCLPISSKSWDERRIKKETRWTFRYPVAEKASLWSAGEFVNLNRLPGEKNSKINIHQKKRGGGGGVGSCRKYEGPTLSRIWEMATISTDKNYCPFLAFSCALASLAARTKGDNVDNSTHCFMNSCCSSSQLARSQPILTSHAAYRAKTDRQKKTYP